MSRKEDPTPLVYARIAGLGYIFIIVVGTLNAILIDSKLIVPGDPGLTVQNIEANELLFRLGIVGLSVMYAAVLVLAVALFVVTERINRHLALLAMLFRSAEAVVGITIGLFGFGVLFFLSSEGPSTTLEVQQWYALTGVFLDLRAAGLDLVLVLVGVGGAIFCCLLFTSRYVPRPLAAWGIFTYLSMIVLAIISILMPNHPAVIESVLFAVGGAFELIFGSWLLVKGVESQPRLKAREA